MNKQENENLIQELEKRLEWYTMEASDEEFDAEQVQALMKVLDSLQSEEKEKIEEELPVEEAVKDFWKYHEERENEERILSGREERIEKDNTPDSGRNKSKVVSIFLKHRGIIVAAVVLIAMILGGSWEAVANAEKHGGFFWWMDKSEEGTTMITSPEGDIDFGNDEVTKYYDISEVPEEYKKYIEQVCKIPQISEYKYDYSGIVTDAYKEKFYILMKGSNDVISFEIVIYPKKVQQAREMYSIYTFENEIEDEGVAFDILSKEEKSGEKKYLIYFYHGHTQYIITGKKDEETLQNIAIECKNVVVSYDSDK